MAKMIAFPEQNVVYGVGQDEYLPLPAFRLKGDEYGRMSFLWKLTLRERIKVLFTGKLWHEVLTFNNSLQPQRLSVPKPEYVK